PRSRPGRARARTASDRRSTRRSGRDRWASACGDPSLRAGREDGASGVLLRLVLGRVALEVPVLGRLHAELAEERIELAAVVEGFLLDAADPHVALHRPPRGRDGGGELRVRDLLPRLVRGLP